MINFQTSRLMVMPCTSPQDAVLKGIGKIMTPEVAAPISGLAAALENADGLLGWVENQFQSGGVISTVAHNGEIVGIVIVMQPEPDQAMIGYILARDVWGQGMATELVQGLINHLGGNGVRDVYGGVGLSNPASARVLEKVGFYCTHKSDDSQHFHRNLGDRDA